MCRNACLKMIFVWGIGAVEGNSDMQGVGLRLTVML